MSCTAPEKNQHARRNYSAIPAAAAIATTVRRPARVIPQASAIDQRVRGPARERRPQLLQHLPPGRRHQ